MQLLILLACIVTGLVFLFCKKWKPEPEPEPGPEKLDAFVADLARVECEELPYRDRLHVEPKRHTVTDHFSPADIELMARIVDKVLYGTECCDASYMPEHLADLHEGVSASDICRLAEHIDQWLEVQKS